MSGKGIGEMLAELEDRATGGDSAAMWHLSTLYERGYDSIPADSVLSMSWLKASASRGYLPAQSRLGYLYRIGRGVEANPDSTRYWLTLAADRGDAKAINNLGYLMLTDSAADLSKARMMFERAAEMGLPEAMVNLADMLRHQQPADTLKAEQLYLKATSLGLADAQKKLLEMMSNRYQSMDAETALAAGLEAESYNAMTIAVLLFEQAAEAGNVQALALLGEAISKAGGADYDYAKVLDCYKRAALGGEPSAQYIVAELLEFFPDIFSADEEMSAITSTELYERAAEAGVIDAATAAQRLHTPPGTP